MKKPLNLYKSASLYFAGSLLNAAIPFLLLPVFTKYLTAADFGWLSLVQVFSSFVFPLVIIGIHGSINTEYYRLGDKTEVGSYLSSALLIPLGGAIVVSLAVFIFGESLTGLIGITPFWMRLCVLLAALQVVPTVVLFLLQASQKPVAYSLFQIGITTVNIGLSLVLVVWVGLSWEGRMYGLLGTNLLFSAIGLIWLRRSDYLVGRIRTHYIREAFRFGFFLIPHEVGGIVMQLSNRIIINLFAGVAMLGVFSVAYQVGSIIAFIAMAFNQAWVPYLFSHLANASDVKKEKLVKLSYLVMAGFLVCSAGMIVAAKIIFRYFIDIKFAASEPLVFWIALSFGFTGMYFVVVGYIFYEKKTHILAYITISCGALNVALTYGFTRAWGIEGTVMAQAIGNLIFFLSTWILSARIYPMPWLSILLKEKVG